MIATKQRTISFAAVLVAGAAMLTCTQETPRRVTTSTSAEEAKMKKSQGFVEDIDALTTENRDYRRVLHTGKHLQLVLMTLKPGEDIGAEVHDDGDQFFRVEAGAGEVVIDDRRSPITTGTAIVIPAGARHNVINTGKELLQVYTLYGPPHHRDKVVHPTKADAERDDEKFDGKTTE